MRSFCKTCLAVLLSVSLSSCAMAESSLQSMQQIEVQAPALPAVRLDTEMIKPSGRTIRASADFQKALNEARPGDVIELEAGKSYTGNFTLPRKEGKDWIIIRSSKESHLPPAGTRVSPTDSASMPKIISPNSNAAIATAAGAHHFRFIGIEFTVAEGVSANYNLIALGSGGKSQATLDEVPNDIIIDRCFIHGNATAALRRGITLNSARTAVIDSYISDCKEAGADSQAICGWNGPGPFKIVNNYLEAAGENVMFGGGEPQIKELVPSDIEFRRNHCFKPLKWKADDPQFAGHKWTIKNLFELKNARRVLIDANLFENNWADAQTGYAILFTVRSQGANASWTIVEDITFTNNIVRHASAAVNILGRDKNNTSQQASRISIINNLFEDINSASRGGDGAFLKITDAADVTIDHNTVINSGNVITAHGPATSRFIFTNNIVQNNKYGVKGDGAASGHATLKKYFSGFVFRRNAIAGGQSSHYPDDNIFPTQITLTDQSGRLSHRSSNNSFTNAGTDGKNIGCDMDKLKSTIECASSKSKSATNQSLYSNSNK